jgi:hypothetical protein
MNTADNPGPNMSRALALWLSLTRWIIHTSSASAKQLTEDAADAVKDTLLDFALPDEDGPLEQAAEGALPRLDAAELSAALHAEIECVLHRATEVINESPSGRWSAATEEKVLALFEQLGHEVLAQALELRVARAEAAMGAQEDGGLWARRYRRMLAAEGHWPPAQEAEHSR